MRLQRLECDYFIGGPEVDGASSDWTHGRAQHVRQAFFESLWAGYRTGALALRKTFTAWRCLATLPGVQSEEIRKHGLERMEQTFSHCFSRYSLHHLASVLRAWAQVVHNTRLARDMREKQAEYSQWLNNEVSGLGADTAFSYPHPFSSFSSLPV